METTGCSIKTFPATCPQPPQKNSPILTLIYIFGNMLSFQLLTQLNCVITVENILTRANYFYLSDPTVVLYWRARRGPEISKRNRGIPPLVQAIIHYQQDYRKVLCFWAWHSWFMGWKLTFITIFQYLLKNILQL